jgi:RsiW-degrading membrane proteinase PrsW (M82 family)
MTNFILGCALASFVNFAIHAVMTGLIVVATRHTARVTDHLTVFLRLTALLTVTMVALMAAHVAEIGVWAIAYSAMAVTPPVVTAFDFAFENYTALGYGDAVPSGVWRVVGPITALNGLLLMGWSVAIIFEVMRMAEVQIGRIKRRG